MKLCFGAVFYNLFKWVYIEYIKMKKKKGCTISCLLQCSVIYLFLSLPGRCMWSMWQFYILGLGRFYCGDETPAVVTAICTKTCEFIVASIPVATINWNGRENSYCASQAIESCEEGEWSLSKLESPRQKKFPLLFAEEKELSLDLCLIAVFLCNSAVLILIKWHSHATPFCHYAFLKTV